MFYSDENEESFKIKQEELDIKDEIIDDPPVEEEKPNTIKKIRKNFYECKECNYSTNDSDRLNEHLYRIHEIRDQVKHYECYNCGDVFTNKYKLSFHIKKELNILKPFKCSKCEYSTFNKDYLRQHYLHKHTADEEIEWFKCTECDYKGKTKNVLNRHKAKHSSPTKKFKCNDCIFSTRLKYSLKIHIRRKHQTEENIEMFHCNECDFHNVLKHRLKLHIKRKHTSDEQSDKPSVYYNCKKCDFRSKYSPSLARHEQIHLGGCFPCDRCEYKGKTKRQLQNHLNYKHLKGDAYKCKECRYTTPRASTLRRHVKCKHIHT